MKLILEKKDGSTIEYSPDAAKSVLRLLPISQMAFELMKYGSPFITPEGAYKLV